MLGTTMMVIGVVLCAGSIGVGYYLISAGCTIGCDASTAKLISALMISDEGIFFWLAWVAGVFLVWGGSRIKAQSGKCK